MATSRIVEHVGRVLSDRYRLTRPLGTGASAHVYVADDVTLRRLVAVKVLHPGLADDEAFLRRFQAEARVVAALRHPNIVRVYDWGEDHGSPFLVMELLAGGSLRRVVDRGQLLSPAQAARVGADTARALDYAHRRGLVHRDIKPANLLFDEDGQVSVADFGLARALAEATWTEPVGAVLGTARYAAPEQIGGGPLDGRADVYALALVLVEAVTGQVPFATDTTIGTLMARVDRDLLVPDELGPLAPVLAAAGTSDPATRCDAAALANALSTAGRQLPPPAPLTLAGASDEEVIDEDPGDLTELPGRRAPFDRERVDREPRAPVVGDPATEVGPAGKRPMPTGGPASSRVGLSPPRNHPKRRWLAVFAVIVAAALVVGAVAWSRAAKPRHPVPSLVAGTLAAARLSLTPLHLRVRVAREAFDTGRPKGEIVSQEPAAHVLLREGSSVSVVVSLGPPPVTLPNLVGLALTDATNRLIGAGLMVGTVTSRYDDNAKKGVVLSWSGEGGQLPLGSAVDLVVSNGPPVTPVPSVATTSFAAAQASLAAVNLTAVENDEFSNTVAKGLVIGTAPPPGTSITIGSAVTVDVSKGPDLVTVPSVRGRSVGAATQALEAAGFNVIGVSGDPINTVTRSSPAGGASVLRGSSVTLFTS